jgi:MFS transporter, PHS family, inorganic phosphate transporter
MMTAVFACQGWGTFGAYVCISINHVISFTTSQVSSLLAVIIVSGYKSAVLHDDPTKFTHVDSMWRLLIGFGCVPAAIALYFRLTIPETPRFTMDIERNLKQAAEDVDRVLSNQQYVITTEGTVVRIDVPTASRHDFISYFRQWKNLKILIGTCWSWLALDVSPTE